MQSKKNISRNGNMLMATTIYKQIPTTQLSRHDGNGRQLLEDRFDQFSQIGEMNLPRTGRVSPLGLNSPHHREHASTMDKRVDEKQHARNHSTLHTYHGDDDGLFSTFSVQQRNQFETMMSPDRPRSKARIDAEQLMETVASKRDKANNRQKSALMTHAEISSQQGMMHDPYHLDENVRLVPDRWNPTGWKYVKNDPADQKFFNSPNKVNLEGAGYKLNSEASLARSVAKGCRSVLPQRPSPMSTKHNGFNVKAIVNYPKAMPLSSFGKLGHVIAREQSGKKVVDTIKSSYQDFFDKSKQIDVRAWKQRFDNEQAIEQARQNSQLKSPSDMSGAKVANRFKHGGENGDIIHWAGEQHARKDFNRKKDRIADWAQVLYQSGL